MALTFYWRCEATDFSAANGTTDYSAGSAVGTNVNSPSYSETARLVGSTPQTGLLIDADERVEFSATSIVGASAGCVALWVTVTSITSDPEIFFEADDVSTAHCFSIVTTAGIETSTGTAKLIINRGQAGVNEVEALSANLALNTPYFFIAAWDDTANDRYIGVYNSSGALIVANEDPTTNWTGTGTPTVFKIGNSGGFRGYIDNVFIGNAYADKDVFLSNRNITSYASYSTGSSAKAAIAGRHYSRMRA